MDTKDFARQIENLAVLDEPVRRKLYLYVVRQDADVTRDEAARAVRVSRSLAAFHLDKLVEANLLQASFRRLSGRDGPGAGRPSKLYRRSAAQFDVTLPRRRYDLAAHILSQALANADREETLKALRSAAREWGKRLARESGDAPGRGRPLTRAARALETCGFDPQGSGEGDLILRNCPFDSLRDQCKDLICAMNLAMIEGLLVGLGVEGIRARLSPRPGMCCVALRGISHGGV